MLIAGVVVVPSKKQIAVYVSDAEYRDIAAKAQAQDMSMSQWMGEAASEKIEREGIEGSGARYQIERRLLSLVDEAADRAADRIVEQVTDAASVDAEAGDDALSDWGSS